MRLSFISKGPDYFLHRISMNIHFKQRINSCFTLRSGDSRYRFLDLEFSYYNLDYSEWDILAAHQNGYSLDLSF